MFFSENKYKDVSLEVLSYLSKKELLSLRLISKSWERISTEIYKKKQGTQDKKNLNNALVKATLDYMLNRESKLYELLHIEFDSTKRDEALKKIEAFIKWGADVNSIDNAMQKTPLHIVHQMGGDEFLQIILEDKYKADRHIKDSKGYKTFEKQPEPNIDYKSYFREHSAHRNKCSMM